MSETIGYGSKLFMSSDTTTLSTVTTNFVARVRSIEGPTVETEEVECTTLDSTLATREFLLGLIDPGNMTFDIAWNPELDSHQDLTDALTARTNRNFRLNLPTTTLFATFSGRVNSFSPTIPIDDVLTASVGIRLTGAITWPTTST